MGTYHTSLSDSKIKNPIRLFYAFLIGLISLWVTMNYFEGLWPGAVTKPMALPMFWIVLTIVSGSIALSELLVLTKEKAWVKMVAAALIACSPLILGYVGLLYQQISIGFVLGG